MTVLARDSGQSGALFDVQGTVPINATWSEDIYFLEAGAGMDLTGLDFKMTLRCSAENTSADYTLSTDAGTLSIVADSNSINSILRVNVPAGTLTTEGDYIADLASQDSDSKVLLWAHGVISLRQNPVTF